MEFTEKEPYKSILYVIYRSEKFLNPLYGIKPKEIRYILSKNYAPKGKHKLRETRRRQIESLKEYLLEESYIDNSIPLSPQKLTYYLNVLKKAGLITDNTIDKGWQVVDAYKIHILSHKIKTILNRGKNMLSSSNMILALPKDIKKLSIEDRKRLQIIEFIINEMYSELFLDIRYRKAKQKWNSEIIQNKKNYYPVLNLFFWIDCWLYKMQICGPKYRYPLSGDFVKTSKGEMPIERAVRHWIKKANKLRYHLLIFHIEEKYPNIEKEKVNQIIHVLYSNKKVREDWSKLHKLSNTLEELIKPKEFMSILFPSQSYYLRPPQTPEKYYNYRELSDEERQEIKEIEETDKKQGLRETQRVKFQDTEISLESNAGAWVWLYAKPKERIEILKNFGVLRNDKVSLIDNYPDRLKKEIWDFACELGYRTKNNLDSTLSEYITIYACPPLPDDVNKLLKWR
ncbi:MAG: hypothetical protein DRP50_03110 [Thermotoga sp.]|nr:MAG: hypothetical protein DRP50_03110 [Thermotoga sp.]